VLQYNKRDLPEVMSVDELNELLNEKGWPVFEACASDGKGVFDTLKYVIKIVLDNAKKSSDTLLKPETQKSRGCADSTGRDNSIRPGYET